MVAPTLVKITLFHPNQDGDAGVPFTGRAWFKPSLQRHIEGETPPDYVVTDRKFWVTFGAALDDNPATPGVAWVYLEPTDYGPYADAWAWEIGFTVDGQTVSGCDDSGQFYLVPTSVDPVDFGDLENVSPFPIPSSWVTQLAQERAERIAADEDLQDNIDAEEAARVAADADLQNQIDAITNSDVESVNGQHGAVVVALVESPPNSFFYQLQVTGT